jgi:predicted transglutaminase-like cysteine proteinase
VTTVQTFLDTNAINGALTPEQAAQLLELPTEGDTTDEVDTASAPAPAPATPESSPAVDAESSATKTDPVDEAALSAENAVILAKDGKHVIPFDKLAEARDSAQRAAAERDEAVRRAQELEARLADAAKQPPAEAKAPAAPEAADLKALREQHFEAVQMGDKALALQLQEQIEAEVQRRAEQAVTQRLQAERAQEQARVAAEALARVAADAKAKYPALNEQGDKADQDAIDFVLAKRDALISQGTLPHEALAQAVAKAAALFKWDGQAAPTATTKDAAAAAAAAIANAKATTPATLSDIPGGKPAGQTLEARMAVMNGVELVDALSGMSPEQIDEFLNRSL